MVKENFKSVINPISVAALFVCVAVYTGFVPVKKQKPLLTLCPREKITFVEGTIHSNPVKNSARGTYSFLLETTKVGEESRSCSCSYSASGFCSVVVPETMAEALLPGKLYTLSFSSQSALSESSALVMEKGSRVLFYGKMKNDIFIASGATPLPWEDGFSSRVAHLRALSRLAFRRMMYYWKDAGGLFLALISGICEYTDETLKDSFRKAGLSHILALSGMHLSLFSGISKNIFSGRRPQKLSLVFQFLFISIFVWFAGLSPSLLRAFIQSSIVIFLSFFNIKNPGLLNVLSGSFLIHSVIHPEDLFSLAFMLSYGALLGIILFGDLCTVFSSKAFPFFIAEGLGGSMGAQSVTLPVTLKAMGTFSPGGIISTLVVSPLITFFIYSGLLLFILSLIFPFACVPGAFFMNILYNLIEKSVTLFSKLPQISI